MTAQVTHLRFSLDPLMAEAKRRARQRRAVLSAVGGLAIALALFLAFGSGFGSGAGQNGGATASRGGGDSVVGQLVLQNVTRKAYFVSGRGGITKPPGGAALRHKHKLISQPTAVGPAAIWVAPDWAVRGTCAWLTIGRAVDGGECRRSPPPRGLWEVVPLHLKIKRQFVTLLWGHAGRDVARLAVRFQDGTATRLPLTDGVFLHVFPKERWVVGHRPAWLVARGNGRVVRVRLITNSRFLRPLGTTETVTTAKG